MAEPLSFAASIIAVAQATQAAGQLLIAVYGYCKDVKGAPNDARKLSVELESLRVLLKRIEDYGKKNKYSTAIEDLDDTLKECARELEEVHSRLPTPKKGLMKRLWRLKWPLQTKETMNIMTRIERYKSTFSIGLAVENIVISRNIEAHVLRVDSMVQEVHISSVSQTALSSTIKGHVQSTELGVQELHGMSEDHVAISKKIEGHVQHTGSDVREIKEEQHAEFLSQDAWRERMEKDQAAEKRKKVLNWVFPGQCDKKHIDISARRREGTGKWLWETPEVKKWISDPDSPILWGRGIPGAGKTFLSSALIDHVEKHVLGAKDGVAHIYFDYKEQEQQKAVDILASLVKQFISQIPHLPTELEALHDKLEEKNKRPESEALLTILLTTFKSFDRVFLIFDALDECHQSNQRKYLLPLFNRMSMKGVNLFITSRPYPEDIQQKFLEYKVAKLELLAREEDITIYIKEKIDENPRAKRLVRQGRCQEQIISELVECAKGMFLLVHFHVKYICEQTTAKQILEALDRLKSSTTENRPLDPTYNRAIENLRSQSKSCTALAINTLSWLVKAKRPMTADEVRVAVSVQPGRHELDDLDLPDDHTLLDVCSGLVMIDEHSNTIKLVHYTVQEYLLGNDIIPSGTDFMLAVACTTYLLFDIFAKPPASGKKALEWIQLHPFLRYAAPNLSLHLKTCDNDVDLAKNVVMKFLETTGNVLFFLEICRKLEIFSFLRHSETRANGKLREWEAFNVACNIGHYATVEILIENGVDLLEKDALGRTALHLAVPNGHRSIVQLLLDKGADLSAKGGDGWTALHHAASNGHHSIAQLLLENGADPSVQQNEGWTALHHAASNGHHSIAQLLLENGADPSVQHNKGWTALHQAASNGHHSIAQLLLENGADPSVQDNKGWTALHQAASNGHHSIAQLLLEKSFDLLLKARNNEGDSALTLAAYHGNKSIVRILLDKGADMSVQDNYGLTALELAEEQGHYSIVKLLHDRGASSKPLD